MILSARFLLLVLSVGQTGHR